MGPEQSRGGESGYRRPWYEVFRRVTSHASYLPEIDGLRFIAIFWVFVYHLEFFLYRSPAAEVAREVQSRPGGPLLAVVQEGAMGVQLFFVISGFILSLPFARAATSDRALSVRRYFSRRMIRLEPPFLICIAILFCIQLSRSMEQSIERLPNLLATLTYTHTLVHSGELSPINNVTWSLEVEAHFYLLMPVLALLYRLKPRAWRVGILLGGMFLLPIGFLSLPADLAWLERTIVGQIQYFLAGLLLTEFYLLRGGSSGREGWFDAVGFVLGCGILLAVYFLPPAWLIMTLPLLVAGCYACILAGRDLKRVLSVPALSIVGGMCYTIYLYHFSLLRNLLSFSRRWTAGLSPEVELLAQVIVVGGPMLLICAALFLLFEKPFMSLHWIGPRRTKPAPPYLNPGAALSGSSGPGARAEGEPEAGLRPTETGAGR